MLVLWQLFSRNSQMVVDAVIEYPQLSGSISDSNSVLVATNLSHCTLEL
jgi:hypothetical protein